MRTKPGVHIEPDQAKISDTIEALLAELSNDELKHVASAVIHDYQCRMQKAQALFEEISQLEAAGAWEDLACRQHHYRLAMLNVHAQHQLVRLVITRLGHVPEIDRQRLVVN